MGFQNGDGTVKLAPRVKSQDTRSDRDMNSALRILTEYSALSRVLEQRDMFSLTRAIAANAPEILRTRKLTVVDAAMSRNLAIRFDKYRIVLPIADIDRILTVQNDNPTFGNLREIYARNCYLRFLRPRRPLRAVLDLGANRGMFSLLALVTLGAETAVGVEPTVVYESVYRLLLESNRCNPARAPRYLKFISSPSLERQNPEQNVSIQTVLREQNIERFNLVKIDIEGHEKALFAEPEWLANVDDLCMELHHHVGELSSIPRALDHYGFAYRLTDQHGKPADMSNATFLYASCMGQLIN